MGLYRQDVVILDANGKRVRGSRNLRAIMEELRVSTSPVKLVTITCRGTMAGILNIQWENGHTVTTEFASFTCLREWVHNRRNLRGAPLLENGRDSTEDNRPLTCGMK